MAHADGSAFARRSDVDVISAEHLATMSGLGRHLWYRTADVQLTAIVIHPDALLRASAWFHLQTCYPGIDWRMGAGDSIHTEDL